MGSRWRAGQRLEMSVSSLWQSDVSVSTLTCLATNEDCSGVEGKGKQGKGGEGKEGRY